VKLLIATRNSGKLREIKALLSSLKVEFVEISEFPNPPIVEEGENYKENAEKKALEFARFSGLLTFAEDSGIEVEALGGRPGALSARYSGKGATDKKKNAKLLKELEGLPKEKRRARYVSVVALASPEGIIFTTQGESPGYIALEERGEGGFGYDPLFMHAALGGKTFGEVPLEVKNKYSHRAQALKAFKTKFKAFVRDKK
jgi:XTP/dITP diphosphohydrolase